jgi:hypothetical protein
LFERVVRPLATAETPGAFPQIRKVSLVELGTHVETAFLAKPITTGEQAVLPALLRRLPDDALLLWDRGFFSYNLWKTLVSRGIRVLARVIQELYALSLAHFVTRATMFAAAASAGMDPDRLSFYGCFHVLQCRLPECDGRTAESLARWYAALLWELSQERLPPRRNRINPRVIKQKVSKWPKKRPAHSHPPPLQKTFMQSVVMTN